MDKLIRLKGSDKVYLIKSTKHWLKTAETLTGLGFSFGDEVEVNAEEFAEYEEGEPIEVATEFEGQKVEPGGIIYTNEVPKIITTDNDIVEPVRELWQ